MTRRPYIIWSPPWDHKVGGIRALHALRDELRVRGCVAWMQDEVVFDPEAIVVYPEIVQDNPLGAERVVRWRLSPAEVPDDGLIYDWLDYGSIHPTMCVDLIDADLFARRECERSGTVLWVHKGRADLDLIPQGAVTMTENNPETRREVADLLSRAALLVSFDEFSTVNLEAILLGTPVLLYPSGGWFTEAELRRKGWSDHGAAFSPDEVDEARVRTASAWPWYRRQQRRMMTEIDIFVIHTQARWPSSG